MYYIEIAELKGILDRMKATKPGETICLSGKQVAVLLKHIEELKTGKDSTKRRGIGS